MFWNGRTAIDGMSGSEPATPRSAARPRRRLRAVERDAVDADRPGDVLQLLLAVVDKADIDPAFGILLDAGRHADAARLGQALEARSHVHAVAENVVVLDDDVADMDADAELDALGLGATSALRSVMPRCTSTPSRPNSVIPSEAAYRRRRLRSG